jgi:KxxxW cyclic peptide radical SAM maturase
MPPVERLRVRVSDRYIFRHEFFGALILSRYDATRFVLRRPDALLVALLDADFPMVDAVRFVTKKYPEFRLGGLVAELLAAGALHECEGAPQRDAEVAGQVTQAHEAPTEWDHLSAPLNLSIYPYMRCQIDCRFCYVTDEKWVKGHSPATTWLNVVREAKRLGVPTISVLGGDPSLYPGIVELIEGFDRLEITGTMTTNGLNVRPALRETIAGSTWLVPTVSVQSMSDLHERLTGRSQDKALDLIRFLRSQGKTCNVNAVYISQSDQEIFDLIDFCADVGVAKLSLAVFIDVKDTGLPVPSFAAYRRIYELGLAYLQKSGNRDLTLQVEGCQLYTAYPDIPGNPTPSDYERLVFGCEAGNGRFEIMHDGQGLPCALLSRDRWSAGNVFADGLATVWHGSSALHRIRSYKNTDTSCTGCGFGSFCNGGCPAKNELEYGSIEKLADSRCAIRAVPSASMSAVGPEGRTRLSIVTA